MIDLSNDRRVQYDGPCIYCGAAGVDLRNEHVLPQGLGGNYVLLNSSCSDCEQATSRVERFISQRMWDVLRKRAGVKGKKKKRKIDPPYILVKNKNSWKKKEIESEKFPLCIAFPDLNGPRILEKKCSDRSDVFKFQFSQLFTQQNIDDLRISLNADRIEIQAMRVNVSFFGMQLAKIAHSFAISEIGKDNFVTILDKIWNASPRYELDWIVGGYYKNVDKNSLRHPAFIEDININGIKFVTVVLSLFSDWGAPYYRVVVGFRKTSKILVPFKRLKKIGVSRGNLNRVKLPTIIDYGNYSYICENCDNVVIQGCNGVLQNEIVCRSCFSLCVDLRNQKEFGHRMDDRSHPITRVHELAKNENSHICVHGLGSGFVVHFVSPVERDDDGAFNYDSHADEAGLTGKEIKIL